MLRAAAVTKLRDERFNCEVGATLAVLAARHVRPEVVVASVALQVMYDYLDGVTELPHPNPLRNSRQLYGAFSAALSPDALEPDWYRHQPGEGDGGYLTELAAVCRDALWLLPAAHMVLPAAAEAALRCGEAQSRVHAIPRLGTEQLAAWAGASASGSGLAWWEFAAGAAASVLSIHALVSAAADPRTTVADAHAIDAAYLAACALSTLLDSLVDQRRDDDGDHRFIAYYPSAQRAIERMSAVAAQATASTAELRHADHHAMTVAGVAAYYLSAPEARAGSARVVTDQLVAELRPLITPILALFRLWRLSKRPSRSAPAI